MVAGVLLILFGIGWLLDMTEVVDFPLWVLTPVALIIVGIALIAGSRRGSSRGLIWAGLVLILLMIVGRGGAPGDDLFGFGSEARNERRKAPRHEGDLRPYHLDFGKLTISLDALRTQAGRTYRIEGSVDAGELIVEVPDRIPFRATSRVMLGRVVVEPRPERLRQRSGVGVGDTYESPDFAGVRPRFILDLQVRVGSVRVVVVPTRVAPGKKSIFDRSR